MTPHFHFIVSTVGRSDCLDRLLKSLEQQQESYFLTVVEQAPTPASQGLLEPLIKSGKAEYIHTPDCRGLSRGRNRGMNNLRGAIVGFPDDDCWFRPGELSRIYQSLTEGNFDGITTRFVSPEEKPILLRWPKKPKKVTVHLSPRTAISSTIFLRKELVEAVGDFDVTLGVGSGTPFGSGEETDFLIRCLHEGANIQYFPNLSVYHPDQIPEPENPEYCRRVRSYGRGFGRLLRKHNLVGDFILWSGRSASGVLVYLLSFNTPAAKHQYYQLIGRLEGWFARRP